MISYHHLQSSSQPFNGLAVRLLNDISNQDLPALNTHRAGSKIAQGKARQARAVGEGKTIGQNLEELGH